MPRKRTLPRRRRQAKTAALAQWRRAHQDQAADDSGRCITVHPDDSRCTGRAVRYGYCSACWGDAPAH